MQSMNPELAKNIEQAARAQKMLHFHNIARPILKRAMIELQEQAIADGCEPWPSLRNHDFRMEASHDKLIIVIEVKAP